MDWLNQFYDIRLGTNHRHTDYRLLQLTGQLYYDSLARTSPPVDISSLGVASIPEIGNAPVELEVVSSDAGENAFEFVIIGSDENGKWKEAKFQYLGSNIPVSIGNWRDVFRIRNLEVNSPNIGIVDVRGVISGTAYLRMLNTPTGNLPYESKTSWFQAPANVKHCFLMGAYVSVSKQLTSASVSEVDLSLRVRHNINGTVEPFYQYHPLHINTQGLSTEEFKPIVPMRLDNQESVKVSMTFASTNGNIINTMMEILILF